MFGDFGVFVLLHGFYLLFLFILLVCFCVFFLMFLF